MNMIYQVFLLNQKLLAEARIPVAINWEGFIKKLKELGFTILTSQSFISGLPTMVVVGIGRDKFPQVTIKGEFYSLAPDYGVAYYHSGDWLQEVL